MNKIRTLIAHNDEIIKNEIVDSIKDLEFVEIVGTANCGKETYEKIINLKPEMVFTEYNFDNMNGLEIMKKSREKLEKNNVPFFNLIVDNINENELQEAVEIMGNKLNALVRKPYSERVINILKDYNEYLYK